MKLSNVRRTLTIRFAFLLAAIVGLSVPYWSGTAQSEGRLFSSGSVLESRSSQTVRETRRALDTAISNERANPGPQSARATDEALHAYHAAVEERLADILAMEADILRRKGVRTRPPKAVRKLRKEYAELQASLAQYGKQIKESRNAGFQTFSFRSPEPAVVFNGGAITINASATPPTIATPYPSTIAVSGLTGTITKVTVTLNNFNTTFADNVDILLVGPGANGIIMSDAGGSQCANCPATLTLDDTAATPLPNNGSELGGTGLITGTFQSANYNPGAAIDTFPAPAPAPTDTSQSTGTALMGFNGTAPNGTWSLFVVHDGTSITGSIASWSLDITAGAGACTLTCPADIMQAKDANFCGAIVNYAAPTTSGACGAVTCMPPSGAFYPVGTTTVNCSEPGGATCSFTITVTGTCPAGQVCDNNAITITGGAVATPYPSTINISGLMGQIVSKVTVTLPNFSHTFPDNVDILLVGPTGANAIIMSDVGGNNSISPGAPVTLTLDDAAGSPLPDTTMLMTGTFQPTNINPGAVADVFPAPAPAPSGGSALSVFNGTDPNGDWDLYVVDDGLATESGMLTGWCLNIMTTTPTPCMITCPADVMQAKDAEFCGAIVTYPAPMTTGACGVVTCAPPSGSYFPVGTTTVTCSETTETCNFTVTVTGPCPPGQLCNNNPITINAGATATPYPSDIAVSGLTGVVDEVTVTLTNLSHSFPDNIDVLLVGPQGQNAIIMSDVGGNNPIMAGAPVTLTLDDDAAMALPDNTTLSTGTFRPTNINPGGGDAFPGAPPPSGNSMFSVFDATDPNGTWSLYVVDDGIMDTGMFANGWCLSITTRVPVPCVLTCPADVMQAKDPNFCGAIVTYPAHTTTGDCGAVTCNPPSGAYFPIGSTVVTCTSASGSMCTFMVTITGTCPPGQVCNNTPIIINDSMSPPTTATPYPSQIMVSGLLGNITKVTVTLANFSHEFPDDVDVLLVGPGGGDAIIMSDVGGGNAISSNAPVTLTLDDMAMDPLPDSTMLMTGTFQPTNIGTGDAFPGAPAPSGNVALGTFNGTDPNGMWGLYVVDDNTGAMGAFSGGWCLSIMTDAPCMLTCPADITQGNDMGVCEAIVMFADPMTSGNCGTVTCDPASGSTFPVGTTTVTCTAQSGDTCMFTVTVNDTEAPVVTCPNPITVDNDPGQCGAVVNFTATAVDNCDGSLTPTCTPPSGSFFPVGTTTVTCEATDAAGNTGNCMFTITVNDTEAPAITCPLPPTRNNDPGLCSAVVTFLATARDTCDGQITPVCVPPSGSSFPVGITTVTCTATDAAGNSTSCMFNVTVNDTEAPFIICPASFTVITPDPGDTTVIINYTTPSVGAGTAGDNCGVASIVCNPPSGSAFPLGVTTVTCTVTDTSANTAQCSFTVSTFDVCIEDDTNPGNGLLFISTGANKGDYRICCGGQTLTGRGTVSTKNGVLNLTHFTPTRRVQGYLFMNQQRGSASLQSPPTAFPCVISDSNTSNNTCSCSANP